MMKNELKQKLSNTPFSQESIDTERERLDRLLKKRHENTDELLKMKKNV